MVTVRDAAFDYWRLGLDLARPGLATSDYVLLDRYVLPLLGHLDVELVRERDIELIAFLLEMEGLDERVAARTIHSLRISLALARAPLPTVVTHRNEDD